MSHRKWFAKFNALTYVWSVEGVKYDDDVPSEWKDDLYFPKEGWYRTRRAAQFMIDQGFPLDSIDAMEKVAKEAEQKKLAKQHPIPVLAPIISPTEVERLLSASQISYPAPAIINSNKDELPEELRSSFLTSIVHGMMD